LDCLPWHLILFDLNLHYIVAATTGTIPRTATTMVFLAKRRTTKRVMTKRTTVPRAKGQAKMPPRAKGQAKMPPGPVLCSRQAKCYANTAYPTFIAPGITQPQPC
jgi:hypothetical protein